MPTYRSINIALHSQFDIGTLPEYYPPPSSPSLDPSLDASPTIPPLVDDATSTCSVHVPILPGSQFWIAYSVSLPVPEGHYFLFKLYIGGEKVMSWCAGKEDEWAGKTMFGLFESEGEDGRKRMEKRVLCFCVADKVGRVRDGCMEIRVHRASGRKRVERETDVFGGVRLASAAGGINLVNAGRAGSEQPRRFYRFALIDPVDQPFATFRYYYRTWATLRNLGLLVHDYAESEGDNLSIIEPCECSVHDDDYAHGTESDNVVHTDLEDVFPVDGDGISGHDWSIKAEQKMEEGHKHDSKQPSCTTQTDHSSSRRDSIASGTYIPHGAPSSEVSTGSPPSLHSRRSVQVHRLSVPPSIKLDAPEPTSRPLPLPQKNDFSSTSYRPHPAYPLEEWAAKTPGPLESIRDGIASPPPESSMGLRITGAGLKDAISSAWKRSVGGTQVSKKSEVVNRLRSVALGAENIQG